MMAGFSLCLPPDQMIILFFIQLLFKFYMKCGANPFTAADFLSRGVKYIYISMLTSGGARKRKKLGDERVAQETTTTYILLVQICLGFRFRL